MSKKDKRLQPDINTIKALYSYSGGYCCMYDCRQQLINNNNKYKTVTNIGNICHITAAKKGGPRYDESLSNIERSQYDNLILLCSIHHKVVDDLPQKYTTEYLKKMKKDREDLIRSVLNQITISNTIYTPRTLERSHKIFSFYKLISNSSEMNDTYPKEFLTEELEQLEIELNCILNKLSLIDQPSRALLVELLLIAKPNFKDDSFTKSASAYINNKILDDQNYFYVALDKSNANSFLIDALDNGRLIWCNIINNKIIIRFSSSGYALFNIFTVIICYMRHYEIGTEELKSFITNLDYKYIDIP